MNAHKAAAVLGSKNAVGRISAARQQMISPTATAIATPIRESFTRGACGHSCAVLLRAMLFMLGFTGRRFDSSIDEWLKIRIACIKRLEIFAAYFRGKLVEEDPRIA